MSSINLSYINTDYLFLHAFFPKYKQALHILSKRRGHEDLFTMEISIPKPTKQFFEARTNHLLSTCCRLATSESYKNPHHNFHKKINIVKSIKWINLPQITNPKTLPYASKLKQTYNPKFIYQVDNKLVCCFQKVHHLSKFLSFGSFKLSSPLFMF